MIDWKELELRATLAARVMAGNPGCTADYAVRMASELYKLTASRLETEHEQRQGRG